MAYDRKPLFTNVNEEGETYNATFDYQEALDLLLDFPNDTIVVTIKDVEVYPEK